MCGIFAVILKPSDQGNSFNLEGIVTQLFQLSEPRGRDASGIALITEGKASILREAINAKRFVKSNSYKSLFSDTQKQLSDTHAVLALGHCRLATNGQAYNVANNHPVLQGQLIMVHNGIAVEEESLWGAVDINPKDFDVDTKALLTALNLQRSATDDLCSVVEKTLKQLKGEFSAITYSVPDDELVLATNTGSMYLAISNDETLTIVSSEKAVLANVTAGLGRHLFGAVKRLMPQQVKGLHLSKVAPSAQTNFNNETPFTKSSTFLPEESRVNDLTQETVRKRIEVKRCRRCILPATMPFIEFDQTGECNFCRQSKPIKSKPINDLLIELDKIRGNGIDPDCLVAFSGGRDSSFGLHLLTKKFGMNPIAFTYDWGLVTDLARRNQSRMCGQLGVEHIWLQANTNEKLRNVRLNLNAWTNRPHLGLIPLLTAGDKQFLSHAKRICSEYDLKKIILCTNNFERTDFKAGFSSVKPEFKNAKQFYALQHINKLQMLGFYAKQFLINPSYINRSIFDTLTAFVSYYIEKHDFLYLFDYIDWNETDVNQTLFDDYGWESAEDTVSTWRVGDGTAAFYNYVYFSVAGFTEHDVFRSNLIRHGKMSREEAMELVTIENQPRWQSILEYMRIVGVSPTEVFSAIEEMPKLYC